MEHGAGERVEGQSHTEVKMEMEEKEEYIEIEFNLSCYKEELDLEQAVIPEITLSVKEEIPDHSVKASVSETIVGSANAAPDQCNVFNIKEELGDTNLDFKPASHKFADMDYTSDPLKYQNASVAIEENVTADDDKDPILYNRGKEASVEDECRDAKRNKEETQPDQLSQSPLDKCDKCPKTFKCLKAFKAHCKRVHETGSHKCTECNVTYKCKEYLARHIRNVHCKKLSQCTICKKMYQSKEAVRAHVGNCHRRKPSGPKPRFKFYICDYCQKTFNTKTRIQVHITSVHASGSYNCRRCSKRFKCGRYLRMHTVNVHTAHMQVCKLCGKSMKSYHLKQHMQNMHSDQQQQCKLCGKTVKSKRYLRQHMKDRHKRRQSAAENAKCTPPTVADLSAVTSISTHQNSEVTMKEEPADEELELGPVVLQHMDCNYRPYKSEPQLD